MGRRFSRRETSEFSIMPYPVNPPIPSSVSPFFEVPFRDRDDVAYGFSRRRDRGILEQDRPGHGSGNLHMRQVIRRIENVEGTVPHLEILHVLPADRMLVQPQDESACVRFGAHNVIDQTAVLEKVRREVVQGLLDVGAAGPEHSSFRDPKPRCVRQDR